MPRHLIMLAVLTVVLGCSGKISAPAAGGLAGMVGQEVTLLGRFDGPGKIADYIVVEGTPIYLTGTLQGTTIEIPYDTLITVQGTLEHYVPPKIEPQNPAVATPGEYYFIENARVVVK